MKLQWSCSAVIVTAILGSLAGCASTTPADPQPLTTNSNVAAQMAAPFIAQVVGVQWLNPLQRRDYSTEWQLLWTLGLAKPNKNDDMVRTDPESFTRLQVVASIAHGNRGKTSFNVFHEQYVDSLTVLFHDIYFSSPKYFYNAHSLKDKTTWRELAGIRIEYALPREKLDLIEAARYTKERVTNTFAIGNPSFPTAWTRSDPPDVNITAGGSNAGFTSLTAALDYLKSRPNETVWAMNWDAPSFPPKDKQLNENMVLLVLAGANYKTEREPLAWVGYPASYSIVDFEKKPDLPPRVVQAWKATLAKAIQNANKQPADIGYVIHDANSLTASSPERTANLANAVMQEIAGFDFARQSFKTPALLGEMGAGTALTNVALGIAYANHIGKNVLVAGTTEADKPTAVVVVPPAKVRPIEHDKPWFRARSEATAYLMWWGLRHDHGPYTQGYSR